MDIVFTCFSKCTINWTFILRLHESKFGTIQLNDFRIQQQVVPPSHTSILEYALLYAIMKCLRLFPVQLAIYMSSISLSFIHEIY